MRFVLYMAEIVEYVEDSAAKEDKIVSKVELAMICGLHFELRVGQKLLQSLMNECRDHLTAAEYKERVTEFDGFYNQVFSTGEYHAERMQIGEVKSGDFRVQVQEGKPLEFKTTMVRQRKVFVSAEKLVEIVFRGLGRTDEEKERFKVRGEEWMALLTVYATVTKWIRQKKFFLTQRSESFSVMRIDLVASSSSF